MAVISYLNLACLPKEDVYKVLHHSVKQALAVQTNDEVFALIKSDAKEFFKVEKLIKTS